MKKVIRNNPETKLNANASFSISINQVVKAKGAIRNIPTANKIANKVVKKFASLPGCFSASSGMAISADHCKVFIPIFMDSNKAIIPRKIGCFQNPDISIREVKSCLSTCTVPSGSRTAVA